MQAMQLFCRKVHRPVFFHNDVQTLQEIEKLGRITIGYFKGIVLGKPIYEEKIDLHATFAFLNDLAVQQSQEPTLQADE